MSILDYLPIAEQPRKRDNEARVFKKGGNLMYPEKAKELLTLFANGYTSQATPDLRDAAKIGSKAIDVVLKMSHYHFPDEVLHLPSETERNNNEH